MPKWLTKYWKFWLFVIVLFVLPLFISVQNLDAIKSIVSEGNRFFAVVTIFFVLVLTTVVAPLNSFALIPFSSAILGWQIMLVTTVVAWTIGAVIAFLIARHYGVPAVRAMGFLDDIEKYTTKIPDSHFFTAIIFLRILIPVDILSYALGLTSKIPLGQYTLATCIGVIPYSFILSYAGAAAFSGQYVWIGIGVGLILLAALLFYFFKDSKYVKK